MKSEFQVIMRNGTVLEDVLRKERLNVEGVYQALRQSGMAELADAAAIVA